MQKLLYFFYAFTSFVVLLIFSLEKMKIFSYFQVLLYYISFSILGIYGILLLSLYIVRIINLNKGLFAVAIVYLTVGVWVNGF